MRNSFRFLIALTVACTSILGLGVSRAQTISTFAGTGTGSFSGDGGAATAAALYHLGGIDMDAAGNFYICDAGNNRIRKVSSAGIITTFAGNGSAGYSGDGGAATAAALNGPSGVKVDASGNVYIADYNNSVIRKVNTSGVITTIAGTGTSGYSGDGGAATAARLYAPQAIAIDAAGNLFIADEANNLIRKISTSGIITTVAGGGSSGLGDGGAATDATLYRPGGVAFDASGNLYISDAQNNRIRIVNTSGVINTFAGNGTAGFSGDGGAATAAKLNTPARITFDLSGNLYVADYINNRVRKISTSGIITTICGTGSAAYSGDGGAATAAALYYPDAVYVDPGGSVYISDAFNNRVRKIGSATSYCAPFFEVPTTACSTYHMSMSGFHLNGETSTSILDANACDGTGYENHTSLSVNLFQGGSYSTTINSGSTYGLNTQTWIDFNDNGTFESSESVGGINSWIDSGVYTITVPTSAALGPHRMRVIALYTAASYPSINPCGSSSYYYGEARDYTVDILSSSPSIVPSPSSLSFGTVSTGSCSSYSYTSVTCTYLTPSSGAITVTAPSGFSVSFDGSTYASSFSIGYSGGALSFNIFVKFCPTTATTYSGCVNITGGGVSSAVCVSVSGTGSTPCTGTPSAGTTSSSPGSGGASTAFSLSLSGATSGTGITYQWQSSPDGSTWTNISAATNITYNFTGISANTCYRCNVTCTTSSASAYSTSTCLTYSTSTCNIITTIAGNGTAGFGGDGGAATGAELNNPTIVNFDTLGNMFVADYSNNRIRKISTAGTISTVVGTGTAGYSGDGGAATAAQLNLPSFVIVRYGSLYIADYYGHRIRKVSPTGVISTVAGTGSGGFSGDGGAATAASLYYPTSIAFDASNNMYIADEANNRIRKVSAAGIITTFAGGGSGLGDGGAATAAGLNRPGGVVVDASGNVFIADPGNQRIRKVNTSNIISTYAGNGTGSYSGDGGQATAATLNHPLRLLVDASENIYVGDEANNRVRKISSSGIIITVAGNGTAGFTGDGGPATAAELNGTQGVALDASGNLYIVDVANERIRKVTSGTAPVVSVLSGPSSVCVGASITIVDSVSGGAWSSSSTAVAMVSASGLVTGVSAGTTTISYVVTNSCGSAVATKTITVLAAPATPGAITGPSTICIGTPVSVTDGTSGGSWSSSNPSIATVSGSGSVTGVSAGTAVISYIIINSCGTAYATLPVTVLTTPTAGTITGPSSVCVGSSSTFTDAVSGGAWSTSTTTICTISPTSGLATGIAVGTAGITYTVTNTCGTIATTYTFSVNSHPDAPAAISGTTTVCTGSTTALSDATSGGVWSSSNSSIATVNVSGTVYGVSAGSANITYTVTNSCGSNYATKSVTVNTSSSVSSIGGPSTVCTGSSITLTDASSGGTWTSTNPSVATVSSGVVTGIAVGTTVISYTISTACGTSAAILNVNVTTIPSVGAITGSSTVCTGAVTTLSDATSGGTWSSTATSVASVSPAGVVRGVSAGTATISYTLTNGCGSAAATKAITVSPVPSAGTITGASSVCTGTTITLADGTAGGTWSSSNTAIATVNAAGLVSGVLGGSATITYSVTTSCGSAVATKAITVNPSPTAGTISGAAAVCVGSTITLTDAMSGGTWTSSAPSVASISPAGVLSGVAAGTLVVSYAITNSCGTAIATKAITVNPLPSAGTITGPTTVCAGSSITLTDGATGGVWSSRNTSIATVGVSGVVSGLLAGTVSISYTVTNACGTSTSGTVVNVSALPTAGTIIGSSSVCAGTTVALSDAVTGGVWSSSSTAIATISPTGVVSGVSSGTVTITYTVTTSCAVVTATKAISVSATAAAGTISGLAGVCSGVNITLTTSGTAGGSWSSSNTAVATVAAGVVHGISAGVTTISYSVTSGCGTAVSTKTVTVTATPSAAAITGPASLCVGSSATYTDATTGGGWISSNTAIATINASGIVVGVGAGTATITYFITNSCGTSTTTKAITVNTLTAGVISGAASIAVGASTTLTNTVAGGTWSSTNTSLATVNTTGMVTGVAVGMDTIKYSVTNSCGTAVASKVLSVSAHRDEPSIAAATNNEGVDINVYPNPNHGAFTVEFPGIFTTATVVIADLNGRVIDNRETTEKSMYIDMTRYTPGTYLLRASVADQVYTRKVIIR